MIQYLLHKEINKEKWDHCIRQSMNRLVYAYSWYLDIVCPEWNALVEDEYESVFPLPAGRKLGINYIYQPYFAQQLGIFSGNLITEALADRFLKAIPARFRFAEIHLNTLNTVDASHYTVVTRINHELDIISSYENIHGNYDQNTKRNVRKAQQAGLTIRREMKPDELITLFMANRGRQEALLKNMHYDILRRLLDHCLSHTFSTITGVFLPDGKFCAGVFFLKDESRVIFHLAASGPEARENGAMFLLVDSFIQEHAGQHFILDFEGSNDKNVSRFYKGFGAKEVHYSGITINRLPLMVSKAVNFVKKHR